MKRSAVCSLLILSALRVDCMQKRFLVAAPTSPTRHQLVSGIGIPLQLENEAITLGIVLKAYYTLPENANQLKFNFFPDIWSPNDKLFNYDYVWQKFPNGRRRREVLMDPLTGQSYESYNVTAEQTGDVPLNATLFKGDNDNTINDDDEFDDQFEEDVQERKLWDELPEQHQNQHVENDVAEMDDVDLSSSRWVAYDALGSTLQRSFSKGFNGRVCVLRAICEAADVQFSEHLMAELFHIFFTPSTTSETVSKESDYDFIKAEQTGRDGEDCGEAFYQCKRSMLEIFTEIHDNPMFQFN